MDAAAVKRLKAGDFVEYLDEGGAPIAVGEVIDIDYHSIQIQWPDLGRRTAAIKDIAERLQRG